jgi:hypothetical protein
MEAIEMTEEDEEFERMLAKIDLQHTPSKDSQLVSVRLWEIDKMIQLSVLAEREACAEMADEWSVAYPHPSKVIAELIRKRGQE